MAMREYILNAEQRIIFRHAFASGGSPSLDLANTESDGEISDDGIFSFTAAMGNHHAPAIRLR
jgi:hypothetical protein